MSAVEYVETMKKIQEYFETFIDEESITKIHFENLVKIIEEKKIREDSYKLKSFFYLLINISNNHKRCSDFFVKIDQVMKIFSDDIKKYFSNYEIFQIFSKNKRILLYLIKENLFTIDHQIAEIMQNGHYKESQYFQYFGPEITCILGSNTPNENSKKKPKEKPYKSDLLFFNMYNDKSEKSDTLEDESNRPIEKSSQIFDEYFEKNRNIGENESYICNLIRNDSIEEFITNINKSDISLNSTIKNSIYETNSYLIGKNITLIEYAAFFGSIRIFKYLQTNNAVLGDSLWNFIVHGNNSEIIDIYDRINDIKNDYKTIFEESIKCHHKGISSYILSNFSENNKEECSEFLQSSLRYYNFEFINNDDINKLSLLDLCKFDHFYLLKNLLENKNIDENTFVEKCINNETNEEEETTALIIAIENKSMNIVNLLLKYNKIDINYPKTIRKYDQILVQKTALFIAVEQEDIEIVKLLLSNENCDINFLNYDCSKRLKNTALHMAVEKENYEIVNILIRNKNIDVNIRDFDDYKETTEIEKPVLYHAVREENDKIVKLLLECPNIDVNLTAVLSYYDDYGEKGCKEELLPLNLAIRLENIEIIKLLLSNPKIDVNKPIINSKLGYGREETIYQIKTPLVQAIETSNMEIIRLLLLNDKLDLNVVNIFTAYSIFIDKQMITLGDNVSFCYNLLGEKVTAFHIVMKIHNFELAKIFLNNKKVDINTRYQSAGSAYLKVGNESTKYILQEETALNMAIEYKNVEIVRLILSTYKTSVNVNLPNTTKICELKFPDFIDRFRFTLEDNFKIHHFNDEEKSPLFIAVEKGDIEILKLLLECKEIDVNFANKTHKWCYNMDDGWVKTTALNKAVESGNVEILKLLLQCEKIDVNFKNIKDKKKERTALHTAVEKENLEIIQLLLNHKNIDVEMYDEYGKTPLQYTNNEQIIRLFNKK